MSVIKFVIILILTLSTSNADEEIYRDPLSTSTIWINEIHYENTGIDADETVEVAAIYAPTFPSTVQNPDPADYKLYLYNGSDGFTYANYGLTSTYTTFQNPVNGIGFITVPMSTIQNGPGGIALIYNPPGIEEVVQFLSYGGPVFMAEDGPADGHTSVDIGVVESNDYTASTSTLSLQGGGNAYDDFFWASEVFKSWDNVNIGQTIADRCIDRSLVGLGPSGGMNIVTTGVDRYQENQWEEEGLMPGDAILTGDTNNYTDYIFLHVEDGETKVRVEWTLNKQYETFIATIGHARIGACAVDGHEDEFKYEVWVNDGVDEVQRLKGGRLGSEGDETWKPYYNQITIDVRDQETLIIIIENNDDSQIHPPNGPNCDHAVLANPRLICECKDRYLTGYGTSAQFGFDSVDDPNTIGIAYSENQWRGGNTITMQNGVTYDEINGGFIAMYPTGTLGGSPTYAQWDVNGLYKTFSAIIGPGHHGGSEENATNSMIFKVYGDGNLLYESVSLSAVNDDYDDLTIDITGVNILRIETDEVTDNTDDWAMIAAPMLTNCACNDRSLVGYGILAKYGGTTYLENCYKIRRDYPGCELTEMMMHDGNTYENFIHLLAGDNNCIEYPLNGKYEAFSAVIGPPGAGSCSGNFDNPMIFEVSADEMVIYTSDILMSSTGSFRCVYTNVEGVNILKICALRPETAGCQSFIVANPMLICTDYTKCDMVPTSDPTIDPTIISRLWRCEDVCNYGVECTQIITEEDKTVPGITCPVDISINAGQSNHPDVIGKATCSSDAFWRTFSDEIMSSECQGDYIIKRTHICTGSCSRLDADCIQAITVTDVTVPSITCPIGTDIPINGDRSTAITGTASCTDTHGTVISNTNTGDSANLPNPGGCPQATFQRTFRCEDCSGNVATCIQTIGLIDPPPIITYCPDDIIIKRRPKFWFSRHSHM